MTLKFKLTEKQDEAREILSSDATHICLFGGSRSGKTFLLVRNIVLRALKAPGSRHGLFRFRLNACRSTLMQGTFLKVMDTAFKGVKYDLNKTEGIVTFDNKSIMVFGGLDDKERTEKILGDEFATLYLNECSQIPYESRGVVLTRLAQKVEQSLPGNASNLKTRFYYDMNPPSKAHWTYKLFIQKIDPETGLKLARPEDYASFKMNPGDNLDNLSKDYLDLLNGLSARGRKRFLEGEFADATPNALFSLDDIEKWRVNDGEVPQLIRVVVAVDPSGSGDIDNADNDAIGIVVTGLGIDGNAYVLEDCTVKCGPSAWGNIAVSAYDRHRADVLVAEINFGGAMVKATIQAARANTNFKQVTASRGKSVRAEPFSGL
jgi:phage terminase large subunit-like protein